MLLRIDIGNTTVAVSALGPQGGVPLGRYPTARGAAPLEALLTGSFRGAVVSSVVPSLTDSILSLVRRKLGLDPLVISHRLNLGITLGVDSPEKVGADRLVDAAWAAEKYGVPVLTADLGTATTLSLVDDKGIFRGGILCAGVSTALEALSSRCAALPSVSLGENPTLIGPNTEKAMESGALYGTAALLEGLTARICQELGQPVTLVLTGGHSSLVSPLLRTPHICQPELLNEGLAWLYQRNS